MSSKKSTAYWGILRPRFRLGNSPRDHCSSSNLLDDFQQHGRLALIPFAIVLVDSIVNNVFQYGDEWLGRANVPNRLFFVLVLVAFFAGKYWRAAATLGTGALLAYGLAFVYSRPGVPPWG